MREASQCPACGANKSRIIPATVAPFVAERVWNRDSFDTHLLECAECNTAFYKIRPDDSELGRLYAGYRTEEYQRQRGRHEPDYTMERNDEVGGEHEQGIRRDHIASVLGPWLATANIRSVLDYGGDEGQFIPDALSDARRVVYDVSGVTPRPGIESVTDEDLLFGMDFDLVMCCMVLEHVADPRSVVESLRRIGHPGTLFYFEVPQDSPVFAPTRKLAPDAPTLSRLKAKVQEIPWVYDTYLKARGAVPPQRRPMMHEHINHFSAQGFRRLLEDSGFTVEHMSATVLDVGWAQGTFQSCVAS